MRNTKFKIEKTQKEAEQSVLPITKEELDVKIREIDQSIANHTNELETLNVALWKNELELLISNAFINGKISANELIGLRKEADI